MSTDEPSILAVGDGSRVTLGVMVFKNLAAAADERDWRGEALRDGLNAQLSQLSQVKVYSKEFIDFLMARKGLSDVEAAAQLGIKKMRSGSFVMVGGVVRVETHIVDVASGVMEASYATSGKEEDFLQVQNKLAFGVISHLNLPMTEQEKRTLLAANGEICRPALPQRLCRVACGERASSERRIMKGNAQQALRASLATGEAPFHLPQIWNRRNAMSKNREAKNLIVGLDVGTSKIVTVVGEITPEGTLEVIGVGLHESSRMKKGMVVNIDSTVSAIQRALGDAELMADCKIHEVYTGIAASHIKSSNANGMVKIKDGEVAQVDIDRVIETASSISLPGDPQMLHVLEQEFSIDGQSGIRKPLGMSGKRLEVDVHIVTGAVAAAQNIMKCLHRCGLEVREMILQVHLVYHDPLVARPRRGVEHLALGRLFWEHGWPEKAIHCLEIALKRCDEGLTWSVMRWLSMALKKTGQAERALSVWEEMLTWPYREDVTPYTELAKYHEDRRKDFEKAMAYVEQALEHTPSYQQREIEMLQRRRQRLEQKRAGNVR